MTDANRSLEERIKSEMTVDYRDALEKNFETAKEFIAITPEGKISLRKREGLSGIDRILLYLLGKVYAAKVGYAKEEKVSNVELMDELGIKQGSLLPWLKSLRDNNFIKTDSRGNLSYHYIQHNRIETVLSDVAKKLKKGE